MEHSDYWPIPTAHREYWEHYHNPYVYEYDSADDGPEREVITRILASHPPTYSIRWVQYD